MSFFDSPGPMTLFRAPSCSNFAYISCVWKLLLSDWLMLLSDGTNFMFNGYIWEMHFLVFWWSNACENDDTWLYNCRRSWRRRMRAQGLMLLVRRLVPPVRRHQHEKNPTSTRITCARPVSVSAMPCSANMSCSPCEVVLHWAVMF